VRRSRARREGQKEFRPGSTHTKHTKTREKHTRSEPKSSTQDEVTLSSNVPKERRSSLRAAVTSSRKPVVRGQSPRQHSTQEGKQPRIQRKTQRLHTMSNNTQVKREESNATTINEASCRAASHRREKTNTKVDLSTPFLSQSFSLSTQSKPLCPREKNDRDKTERRPSPLRCPSVIFLLCQPSRRHVES
jgi:hypothetical protein